MFASMLDNMQTNSKLALAGSVFRLEEFVGPDGVLNRVFETRAGQ